MALTKITTSVVAVNSLTAANIADNSIDATKIANNQILARHIAADALSDQIADNSITAGMIPNATALTLDGGVTVDEITIDADTITATDDFIIDATTNIFLDADGGEVVLRDGGTNFGYFHQDSDNFEILSTRSDGDIIIKGNDGGSTIAALTLDMSAAGAATFNSTITSGSHIVIPATSRLYLDGSGDTFIEETAANTMTFTTNNSERVRITAAGLVGIGDNSPDAMMHATSGTAGAWAGKFENTGSGGAGLLILCAGDTGSESLLDVRNGTETVFKIANANGVVSATNSANITQQALTSSSNAVAWDAAQVANAYHVTTENTTFGAPSNAVEGAIISVEIAQGGTARTIAWNTVFEFAASTAPTMTATANKTDIYSFRYNGSVWQEIGRVQNMAQT